MRNIAPFEPALFWNFTQRRMALSHRSYETLYLSHLQGSSSHSSWNACPLKMRTIECPETSVRNRHSTLRKIPKQRSSHSHRGEDLKSRIVPLFRLINSHVIEKLFQPHSIEFDKQIIRTSRQDVTVFYLKIPYRFIRFVI
jgi:hypothetical protein